MSPPPGWRNPISASVGQIQYGVDPRLLLPSRRDLVQSRLDTQRALLSSGTTRKTPVMATIVGCIYDGRHYARLIAEMAMLVDVLVVPWRAKPRGASVLALPVR